ncbi:hypothetical protein SLEP1_g50437 [Rubroshorea leprosula]|uniref:Uncharacterized protein n=1 Tax=Rubroshorea leprosula TaxID=152421 RepID=A0AAV5M350_9ROSI|nr:hypothetical protein SLEP1_g50437 [Rubroshorea leprosula]
MLRLPTISIPTQGRSLKVYLSTSDKITCINPIVINGQDVVELLSKFFGSVQHLISDKVSGGEVASAQEIEKECTLYFDGFSTAKGATATATATATAMATAEASIVLRDDKGHDIVFSFKLDFLCTNNMAKLADALAIIASKVPITENPFSFQVIRNEHPIYHGHEFVLPQPPNHVDLRYEICNALLQQRLDVPLKDLSSYVIISCELYYCLSSGLITRCISNEEAYHKLREIHDCTYGQDNCASLYHRIHRINAEECDEHQGWRKLYEQLLAHGYYWPSMKQDVANLSGNVTLDRPIEDLESIKALHQTAQEKAKKYQSKMTNAYNRAVKAGVFTFGKWFSKPPNM